ncbi:MAG: hypothetical protein V7754_21685 [Halioglobus sp.]
MFSQKEQESHYLHDLSFIHDGRNNQLDQLTASEENSYVNLYKTPQVGIAK